MMRRYSLFLPLLLLLCCTIHSCTKKTGADTIYKKIQGKWKLIQTASDNGGPMIYVNVPTEQDWQWVFNDDGSGYNIENYVQQGIKVNYSWKITRNDSLWIGTTTHDTTMYYFEELNSSVMVLTRMNVTATGNKVVEGLKFIKK